MQSLQDLYAHKLQDLYSAEQQIVQAMPQMIEQVSNPELRNGFEMHLRQTEQQIRRLEQIFQDLGQRPGGEECRGMRGLIEEGRKVVREVKDPDALDAALIAAQQAVEHYEIAGYGTARTWARQLGRDQDAERLQETLEEESETDEKLTRLAESMINREAAQGDREVSRGVERDAGQRKQSSSGSSRARGDRPSANP